MARRVDRRANFRDAAGDAGRGLVVDDADRLDAMLAVGRELLAQLRRIDAMPPIAGDELDVEPEPRRHLAPQGGEMPGLDHQYPVARRQGVDERGLPRPGAG